MYVLLIISAILTVAQIISKEPKGSVLNVLWAMISNMH